MSLCDRHSRRDWALHILGQIDLGSRRRVRRLVSMATELAGCPAATVTEVFNDPADREGTYRMLSSPWVSAAALADGICAATARTCEVHERVYVAVDGT